MPFHRYTADPDGAFTFYDDASGASMRAAGPAAQQRAQELDAQPMVTPMSAGLPPVPPKPEAQLLAAGPQAPPLPRADAQPTVDEAAAQKAALEAAARPKPQPTAADLRALEARGAATEAAVRGGTAGSFRAAPTRAPAQPVELGDFGDAPAATPAAPAEAQAQGPGFPTLGAAPKQGATRALETAPQQQTPEQPQTSTTTSDSTTVQSGTSSSTTTGFQRILGPGAEQEKRKLAADEEAAKAQAEIVNIQAKASQDIAAEQEKIANLEMAWAADQKKIEEDTQKRLADVNASINQTVTDLRDARVDPKKFWGDMSMQNKVVAGVGVVLGALAQGLGAKSNGALDVLQRAMDQSVQLQMHAIEKKRADVGTLAAVGQQIRQQGFDARTAELGMKIAANDAIIHNIEAIAAKADAAFPQVIDPETGQPRPGPVSLKAMALLKERKAQSETWRTELYSQMRGQVSGQSQTTRQSQVSKTTATQTAPTGGDGGGHLRTVVLDKGDGTQERWAVNDELRDEDYSKMIANAELIKQLQASLAIMRKSKEEAPGLKGEALRRVGEQFKWHSIQAGRIVSTLSKQGVLQTTEQQEEKIRNGNIVDGEKVIADVGQFAQRARDFIIDQGNATQVPMDYGKARPYAPRPAKPKKGK